MRLISFSHTTRQFRDRSKRVTRRLGWLHLRAGDELMGVRKAMGLRKGEKVERLGAIVVLSARRERLDAITQQDVILEGFPDWTPEQFVEFFCGSMRCKPSRLVTRIEYDYL